MYTNQCDCLLNVPFLGIIISIIIINYFHNYLLPQNNILYGVTANSLYLFSTVLSWVGGASNIEEGGGESGEEWRGGWRGRAEIARGISLNHWLWNVSKHGTTHIGLLQCLHIIRVCLLLNFVLHTTQFRFLSLRPGKCGCWLEGLELESWLAWCAGIYFQVERRPSITFTRNSKPDKRLFVGMLL